MDITLTFSTAEVLLIQEALDSHEYWELGSCLPRHDGAVFLPGDSIDASDPYWPEPPSDEELVSIEAVRRLRALADRLSETFAGRTEAP